MEININSPQYYKNEFGIDDDIYNLCQDIHEYFKNKCYSESIDIVGIIPIIAPKETINKGLCKRGYHCEPKYGFASVREYIDYEEYVSADVEKKKKLMLQCVLNSVKTIKTKGRIDFQKFKEDFDVFCKEHRI